MCCGTRRRRGVWPIWKAWNPVDTTERGSTSPREGVIICAGYRKGRCAPSCWGDSHKSRNWGQGGSYQKSHLCVMHWAKSQAHSRFSGQNGGGGLGGQGSGPVVLLWGPVNRGKMRVAKAPFRTPAKPTSWLGFPTHKSINWSQHGQRGEAPFGVGELNFQISLQENILTNHHSQSRRQFPASLKYHHLH